MSEQPVAFDRATGRRFVRVVKDFLTSEVRWRARGLFALLLAFALTINGLNVVNSYVGRDFMTAISSRDQAGFVHQAAIYVGVFAGSTAVARLRGAAVFRQAWLRSLHSAQAFISNATSTPIQLEATFGHE